MKLAQMKTEVVSEDERRRNNAKMAAAATMAATPGPTTCNTLRVRLRRHYDLLLDARPDATPPLPLKQRLPRARRPRPLRRNGQPQPQPQRTGLLTWLIVLALLAPALPFLLKGLLFVAVLAYLALDSLPWHEIGLWVRHSARCLWRRCSPLGPG